MLGEQVELTTYKFYKSFFRQSSMAPQSFWMGWLSTEADIEHIQGFSDNRPISRVMQ